MSLSFDSGERVFIDHDECPIRDVVNRIQDKWSGIVLLALVEQPERFNVLKRRIQGISPRMLTQTLRVLEREGYVARTVYPEVPVRVEYELSPLGRQLVQRLWALVSWADENHDDVREARKAYDEAQSA